MDYRILRKLRLKVPEKTERLLKVLLLFIMRVGQKSDTWMTHTKLFVFIQKKITKIKCMKCRKNQLKKFIKYYLTNKAKRTIINVSNEREEIKMKEVYNYRFEYRLEGQKEFVDTSIWRHARYIEPKEAENWTGLIRDFPQLVGLVKDGFL